ncbi:GNAT family N-acetyltransferase [Pseudonocardia spirodelae]|uniref:GNAT family N-acetyltransferase n=1 Tax=Pseudonocardia spirodelae TaxID=3133431 RepID=A0ABU8T955_9PSEU
MLTVRPAAPADGPALGRIDALTWTAAVSPAPPRTEPFLQRVPVGEVLVADDDGAVAGYAIAGPAPPAVPAHAHVWLLAGLAVHPGHAGRGAGRALVEAATGRARAAGARKLTLRVLGGNTRARALYARCGFVEEGVLRAEFVLDGGPVDDVLMACHLAGPAPGDGGTVGGRS